MEIIYSPEDIINNRYLIDKQLGVGGSGITYAAKDLDTEKMVAIKVLSLNKLDDWKKIDLFEREARVLQQLNYPGIPKYLDYFKIETHNNCSFYIVQELAPGESLQTLVEKGWQANRKTIIKIAEQILDILVYLQQLAPPVIHRDLKPHNIIYQPDTGKLFLVDFGAVQDTYHHTVMGSTVVGTYGYMSPEQFRGGAVLSTDLYSLGCTILFLLTCDSPSELPEQNLKINFRSAVRLKRDFARWLDKLLEPNIRDRFNNAQDALRALRGEKIKNTSYVKSHSTSITVKKLDGRLIINIPAVISHKEHSKNFYWFLAWYLLLSLLIMAFSYSMGWVGLIYIILVCFRILSSDFFATQIYVIQVLSCFMSSIFIFVYLQDGLFTIFSLLPIILFLDTLFAPHLQHKLIREMLFNTSIECDRTSIMIERAGYRDFKTKSHPTILQIQQLTEIEYKFLISEGEPKYQFGGLLTSSEQEWLTTEITNHFLSLQQEYLTTENSNYLLSLVKSQYFD